MSKTTSILLVEDDRRIALALRIRLSAAGYEVLLAATVAEAIAAVEQQVPNIALLDINLPDGDGISLMQNLLSIEGSRGIICIIMTASRKPGLREQAIAKGACAFLEKPFSSKALLDAVSLISTSAKAS